MLRLSLRAVPLQGRLLASVTPGSGARGCGTPLQCTQTVGGVLVDRALAGFNRLMEQGVEPLARLIWAPHRGPDPSRLALRSPLREPPITADPMALRQIEQSLRLPANGSDPLDTLPLPPDLPPPLVLEEGESLTLSAQDEPTLPQGVALDGAAAEGSSASASPGASSGGSPSPASPGSQPGARAASAPPVPQLPPPAP